MNGNGAEKLRREALMQIGNGLREYYSDVLKEAIPNQLTDLLRRLVAPNEARLRGAVIKRLDVF